ncbi:uncharacterized protein LOC144907256 [Branchiostoma floridae x Branchiostoma belcheri]
MGNCCGVHEELDAEPQKIHFYDGPPPPQPADRLIQNTHSPYKGFLVQGTGINGNPRVFRTTNAGNPDATVVVYSYISTPPADGTYVVLQFKESKLYFACKWSDSKWKLILQSGTDAKEITSTADPRVFLQKAVHNGTKDFVFASCVASKQNPDVPSKARVITLLRKINKPAVFRFEGKVRDSESQYFKMDDALQGGAAEQSDECQVQEEQVHK